VSAADSPAARGKVRVVLVRESDGAAAVEFATFRDGAASRAIPVGPGRWTVTAGDPAGWLRPSSKKVEVGSAWTDVEFALPANPTWKPRWIARDADGSERSIAAPPESGLFLVTEDGEVRATPSLDAAGAPDGSIHVPAAGAFAVRFGAPGQWGRVLLDGPPRGAGPALIVASEEDADVAERADDAEPPRGDFARARLTVLLPDGRPAAGADVRISTPPGIVGSPPRRADGDWRNLRLDDEGTAESGFDRAERIVVEPERLAGAPVLLPLRARIEGPGPWTLRWPATEVVVRARDEQGVPLHDFAVSLGGWDSIDAEDGAVRILGAGPGPLRVWVAAPGRAVRDLRLVLVAGEKRDVVGRLRAAARQPSGGEGR